MEEKSNSKLNTNRKYELTQGYLILVFRPKLEYLYISLSGIINQKTLQQNCSRIIFTNLDKPSMAVNITQLRKGKKK